MWKSFCTTSIALLLAGCISSGADKNQNIFPQELADVESDSSLASDTLSISADDTLNSLPEFVDADGDTLAGLIFEDDVELVHDALVEVDVDGVQVTADINSSENQCGNGVLEPGEVCDDGNTIGGDWCSEDCTELIDVSVLEAFNTHRSVQTLTSSNGLTAITWESGKLNRWMESPYHAYGPEELTRDYLYDHFFGVRLDDGAQWLNEVSPVEASLINGTSIIQVVHQLDNLKVTQWWWSPFSDPSADISEKRIIIGVVKLEGTALQTEAVRVASLWNVHAGGEGDFAQETFQRDEEKNVWVESSGKAAFGYIGLGNSNMDWTIGSGASAENPWGRFKAGLPFESNVPSGPLDDGVLGFEYEIGSEHQEAWIGTAAMMQRNGNGQMAAISLNDWVAGRDPQSLLQAELDWWEGWHGKGTFSSGLTEQELQIARQSAAVLKMAQVRETAATDCPSDACFGQILASLIPGKWNISWVRDAAYAIAGLVRVGHLQEAKWGVEFMLKGTPVPHPDGGNWIQKTYIESADSSPGIWGLGIELPSDYLVSVARYFGQGLEESDENSAGPNIEWDNWGLFLWAFTEVAKADPEWGAIHRDVVVDRVIAPLMALISLELSLLVPDSSIWERHWCPHGQGPEPETRKHHAYSSIMAVVGLRKMADVFPEHPDQGVWLSSAADLVLGIREHLVHEVPGTGLFSLTGNLEEIPYETYYLDMAVVEAINFGLVDPGELLSFGTFAALDEYLRMGKHSPGYMRTDDPTWYDAQEWVVMDLRAAVALNRMGQHNRARTLANWITDLAMDNHGLIAELLSDGVYQAGSEDDLWSPGQDGGGDYQGAIPMCGFGPGAYLLLLEEMSEKQE